MVAAGQQPASTSTPASLMRRGYEALARRDLDAVMEVLSNQVVLETVLQGQFHGHAGIRAWIAEMDDAWLDWSVSVVDVRDRGELAIVEALLQGRSAHDDAALSQRFWIVWMVRDGKALRGVHFADEQRALAFADSLARGSR